MPQLASASVRRTALLLQIHFVERACEGRPTGLPMHEHVANFTVGQHKATDLKRKNVSGNGHAHAGYRPSWAERIADALRHASREGRIILRNSPSEEERF
jgi:hypothetical protein